MYKNCRYCGKTYNQKKEDKMCDYCKKDFFLIFGDLNKTNGFNSKKIFNNFVI